MLSNLPSKTVLGERWETSRVLGAGACAQVYQVKALKGTLDYDIVAKVAPLAAKKNKQQARICNTLNYEYMMYMGLLLGCPFCPRVPSHFYGDDTTNGVRYLVMEKLDQDLVAYAKSALTASDIARVGVQILDGLQWMHDKGFVFVDVKPANFMLKGEKLYFVDYGLVERLQVNAVGAFQGTPAFCSLAALGGAKAGAHDDLEAMALVLLSLASGASLPWSQAPTEAACAKMKTDCDIGALCSAANCREVLPRLTTDSLD
ncbi:kinase-like domain-containing protein [Ochromonadaceae sp. CCMP2298]|nr:kinase-like domain-containing protein [Ochromonadaceae sp. CCMP2298]